MYDLIPQPQIRLGFSLFFWINKGIIPEKNVWFWQCKTYEFPFSYKRDMRFKKGHRGYQKHYLLLPKYIYIIKDQEEIFSAYKSYTTVKVYQQVLSLAKLNIIPSRYLPKITLCEEGKAKITKEEAYDFFDFYRLDFNEALISLLWQKRDELNNIAGDFSALPDIMLKLCQKEGIDFDEYIERWAKQLITENYIKE